MTRTKTRHLTVSMFSIAAVGLMAMSQGCSSSSSNNSSDAGSDTTSDTSTTGCMKLTNPLITDFGGDGGIVGGMPFTFQQKDLKAATVTTTGGQLHAVFDTGVPTGTYPYAGVGVPFNDGCKDASGYTSVKFTIGGTLSTGCSIQFSLNDKVHLDVGSGGKCPTADGTGCYPGAKVFDLPATPTDVMIAYSDIGAGNPMTPVIDPTQATAAQWQINFAVDSTGMATTGCTADITIDNIMFVP